MNIFGVPKSTGSEDASDPEDKRAIVYNFLEHELQIENSRAKNKFQRVHRLGKPHSTSSRPTILRFLRFADKEQVMSVAQKKLKDKDFYTYDDIFKDLFDLRKQQKEKQARDNGCKVHFSKTPLINCL